MGKGKGGFRGGMPGGMQGLMKQAQKMQEDLQKAQAEAEELTAEGSAGGGVIRVVANGKHQITEVELKAEAIDPEDPEMMSELFMTAANQALKNVSEKVSEKMSTVAGGANLPGLF